MKISHKRKVQLKLQKHIKCSVIGAKQVTTKVIIDTGVKSVKPAVATQIKAEPAAKVVAKVSLTPKQQQVFDIIQKNKDGINPKGIGLEAGQEESKAAAWATGALKKLAEEGLVQRIQNGNKVSYKVA